MGISFSNIGTVGREQLITSGSNGEPNWSYIPSKGKSTKTQTEFVSEIKKLAQRLPMLLIKRNKTLFLKQADISSLKTVFTGYNSFVSKISQKATGISNAANRASATYTNNGTYSKTDSSLTSSKIDKEV